MQVRATMQPSEHTQRARIARTVTNEQARRHLAWQQGRLVPYVTTGACADTGDDFYVLLSAPVWAGKVPVRCPYSIGWVCSSENAVRGPLVEGGVGF